jgi:signal peptidase II
MQKVQDSWSPGKLVTDKIARFVDVRVSPDNRRKKSRLFLIVAALVVILDQLSKLWIRTHLVVGQSLVITDRLGFTYIRNTGSAFGLLANQTFLLTVVGIASVLIVLLVLRYLSQVTALSVVSIGLLWGGAIGNLIDRLRFGHVIDFVDFRLWGSFHWPAFNVADAAITVGVLVLIYSFHKLGVFGEKVYEHNRGRQD